MNPRVTFYADNGREAKVFPSVDDARDWLVATWVDPSLPAFVARIVNGRGDALCHPTFPIDPNVPLFLPPLET